MEKLGRGYYIDGDVLYKPKIKEAIHLMRNYGHTPGIDGELWDSLRDKINYVIMISDKGKFFSITAKNFDKNKEMFDYGHGRQYGVFSTYWNIFIPRI